MQYPRVKPARKDQPQDGVYVSLDRLTRMQFRVRDVGFLPSQPVHSILNGRYASRLRGRGLNFEELRGYLPGDDIRTLDWKVTARTRKPYVRVYTEERDRPMILLVDQRLGMFFGSQQSMKSVTAAEAAALAAWRALAQGDRVGALVFNDERILEFKPQRSRRQVMRILAAVTQMNHALRANSGVETNPGQFNEALQRALKLISHDALLCLIGDGFGADERSRSLVTRINTHNDLIAGFVFDPLEADLPTIDGLRFSDGARQLGVDARDHRLRERFSQQFQARRAWMQGISLAQQIPFLPLTTARPAADQIRELLGTRLKQPARRRI
ncbi:MAG: DUF58 domain-containing protein [Pseudomonadota bacterium]